MTKEKRLIATNKTEEERDRLTEVWKKRIVSENTVESQLTKAISFLRKRLKDQYDLGLLALSCLLNS